MTVEVLVSVMYSVAVVALSQETLIRLDEIIGVSMDIEVENPLPFFPWAGGTLGT